MTDPTMFVSIASVLEAFSKGLITEADASRQLQVDPGDDYDLAEVMRDNEVPWPARVYTPAEIVANCVRNAEIEGLPMTEETQAILCKIASGEMSVDEADDWRKADIRAYINRKP